MSEKYMTLLGAEQVQSAASTMRSAAEDMRRAADSMSSSLENHQRWMDDWLSRFEAATRRWSEFPDA
jgi:hypothetical protein